MLRSLRFRCLLVAASTIFLQRADCCAISSTCSSARGTNAVAARILKSELVQSKGWVFKTGFSADHQLWRVGASTAQKAAYLASRVARRCTCRAPCHRPGKVTAHTKLVFHIYLLVNLANRTQWIAAGSLVHSQLLCISGWRLKPGPRE